MKLVRLKALWIFLSIGLLYTAWMTGFTFIFTECEVFPNYTMLADGFTRGHLYIQESPAVDTILKDGRRYIFSGPVPALLRLPITFIFGRGIPTGLMIVLFCAGVSMLFVLIFDEIWLADQAGTQPLVKQTFMLTFMGSGISLFMVSIPSIHHESISAAMFFLMAAVYFLVKMHRRSYRTTTGTTVLFGLSLSLSVGSRFSYVYAVAVIGGIFIFGMLQNVDRIPKRQIIRAMVLIISIGLVSLYVLLLYNYLRFGAFLDFGMKGLTSSYQTYFKQGGYFRYDHFPYNIWSLFFRLPEAIMEFPYIKLPNYKMQVQPIGLTSSLLMNTNELTVSVFCLMPILLLSFIPWLTPTAERNLLSDLFIILSFICVAQILSVAFTVASIARYYYDFVPIMMLMASSKAIHLRTAGKISNGMTIFLGAISLIISFALPMNAIAFYVTFIDYKSPLLHIFF